MEGIEIACAIYKSNCFNEVEDEKLIEENMEKMVKEVESKK